jgi:hypothetical protein
MLCENILIASKTCPVVRKAAANPTSSTDVTAAMINLLYSSNTSLILLDLPMIILHFISHYLFSTLFPVTDSFISTLYLTNISSKYAKIPSILPPAIT